MEIHNILSFILLGFLILKRICCVDDYKEFTKYFLVMLYKFFRVFQIAEF